MTDSMENFPTVNIKKMNTKTSSMSTVAANAVYEDEKNDGSEEI